jgi:magnesium-transporting ATPase (P-type)
MIKNRGYYPEGDPTEVALIVAAMKGGLNPETQAVFYPAIDTIPFESDLMYMATLHQEPGEPVILSSLKVPPERVLRMCSSALIISVDKGEPILRNEPLSTRDEILKQSLEMARDGLRVLALAYRREPATVTELKKESLEDGLTFIGFQGMMDPPREGVLQAVADAKRAGVR